jgi:alanine dehydrogenase
LVDYECLVDKNGQRTVAFGRFAGIVGAYNALRMWMQRFHEIRLKAAFECGDMEEMLDYARHHVPRIGNIKLAITGTGRVGQGAIEVLKAIGIKEVQPEVYLTQEFEEPVFTVLSSKHYYHKINAEFWEEKDFRQNPEKYETKFSQFANSTDILIPCHFWDPKAPHLFSKEDTKNENFRIKVISDVTCDLNGSIPTTIRTTTIASPFFDIDPIKFQEMPAFSNPRNITICAVDNLPCELPFDASMAFGAMLSECVIPELVSGNLESIEKATIAKNGVLSPNFEYLSDYATMETEPSKTNPGLQ